MSSRSQGRVLVVDDEASIRSTTSMLLKSAGYDVCTAENGFDALLQLGKVVSDVIISDLNMPQMSGFEFLSVVRRRFPEVPVIAVSGAYDSGDQVPGGVIADAFYSKGRHNPEELLRTVAELIAAKAARAEDHRRQSAPVWIPRNGKDSNGVPFIVLTCTQCLRSLSLERPAGKRAGNTGNSLPVLCPPCPLRHRFFRRGCFPESANCGGKPVADLN